MRCPYRKKVKVYPDGLGRTTEVEFMECDKDECPYWGAIQYEWDNVQSKQRGRIAIEDFVPCVNGCRKVKKECS